MLYPELGKICIDEGGPTSPNTGNNYTCEFADDDDGWCEHTWFAEKCKQTCGLCDQGKVVLMLSSG